MILTLHGLTTMYGNIKTYIRIAREAGYQALEITSDKLLRYIDAAGRDNVGMVIGLWYLWAGGDTTPEEISKLDSSIIYGLHIYDGVKPKDGVWVEDTINRPVEKRWIPFIPPKYPYNYENMTRLFMDCLFNDKESIVSGEDGARAIEFICAVYKSMEVNSWIDFQLEEEVIPLNYKHLPIKD